MKIKLKLRKIKLNKALILVFSNTSILFRVKVDSLDFVTKIILFQQSKRNNKIIFFSKLLFIVKYIYKIYNKILVIIWTLRE